ncbi:MAG: hypothetical protein KJ077_13790 [Anaerolineae bacterium]|nr:hypothetical protein [Anaerolineae bacterium]
MPPWWYAVFSTTTSLSFISLILVGVAAMIVRLKRSRGDERQQMKWLAY